MKIKKDLFLLNNRKLADSENTQVIELNSTHMQIDELW